MLGSEGRDHIDTLERSTGILDRTDYLFSFHVQPPFECLRYPERTLFDIELTSIDKGVKYEGSSPI